MSGNLPQTMNAIAIGEGGAPESLYRLGTSLNELGQRDEACLTLGEVEIRYPSSPIVLDARAAITRIGCN